MKGMQCGDLSSTGIGLRGAGSGVVTTAGAFRVVWGVGFPEAIITALLFSFVDKTRKGVCGKRGEETVRHFYSEIRVSDLQSEVPGGGELKGGGEALWMLGRLDLRIHNSLEVVWVFFSFFSFFSHERSPKVITCICTNYWSERASSIK